MNRQEAAQILGLSAYLDINGRIAASDNTIQQSFFEKNLLLQKQIKAANNAADKERCACIMRYYNQAFTTLLKAPKSITEKNLVNVRRSVWRQFCSSLSEKFSQRKKTITSAYSVLFSLLFLLVLSLVLLSYAIYQDLIEQAFMSPSVDALLVIEGEPPQVVSDRIDKKVTPLFHQSRLPMKGGELFMSVVSDSDKREVLSKQQTTAPSVPKNQTTIVQKPQATTTKKLAKNFVFLRGGDFLMGCEGRESCLSDEMPQHRVSVKSFYLSKYEVTRKAFAEFIQSTQYVTQAERIHHLKQGCFSQQSAYGYTWVSRHYWWNPGYHQTDDDPVVCISWHDIQAYIAWLNKKTGKKFRLPTESEWEYAARAGSQTDYFFGQRVTELCQFANIADQSSAVIFPAWPKQSCRDGWVYTAPIGRFRANVWSLHDMHGNVWEWVSNCWRSTYHKLPSNDPECSHAVIRGGSSFNVARYARSAIRERREKQFSYHDLGFRLAHNF